MFEGNHADSATATLTLGEYHHKHKQEVSGVVHLFVQKFPVIEHTTGNWVVVAAVAFHQNSDDFDRALDDFAGRMCCWIVENLADQLALVADLIGRILY
jgi:hypothetical protein